MKNRTKQYDELENMVTHCCGCDWWTHNGIIRCDNCGYDSELVPEGDYHANEMALRADAWNDERKMNER